MSYVVGSPYRYCTGLDKRGRPVYEDTKVRVVTDTQITLENGKSIEYEPNLPATRGQ